MTPRLPRWASRLLFGVLLLVAVRTLVSLAGLWLFTTDDAYITLRYSRHLAEGTGIVWNPGSHPAVEGYSNFLFVLIGSLALRTGAEPMLVLKLVGCLSLAGACVALYALARMHLGPLGATLPVLALTADPGVLLWTVSGLETPLYLLLTVAAVAVFTSAFRDPPDQDRGSLFRRGRLATSGFLVFLAALTRPEGPVLGLALALGLVVEVLSRYRQTSPRSSAEGRKVLREGLAGMLALTASAAVPYALYTLWKLSHFHTAVPNSVLCKAGYDGDPWVLTTRYLAVAAPFLALSAVFLWQHRSGRALVLGIVPVAYLILLHGADPIIGYYNRHFLAPHALVLVAAAGALWLLAPRLWREGRGPRWEVAFVVAGVLGTSLQWSMVTPKLEAHAAAYAERMATRRILGEWLDARLGPEDSFLIGDSGLVPYLVRANALDAFCLNNHEAPRPPISRSPERFATWAYQQAPRFLVVHSSLPERLVPRDEYGVFPALVADPGFADYTLAAKIPGPPEDDFHYWIFERTAAPSGP